MEPSVRIAAVLIDREYMDARVMMKIDSLGLKCIIPAKDNPKTLRFRTMEMH
jgi:hypothetical protein